MSPAEGDLERAVEEVLGSVWPGERRRAARQLIRSTLVRAAAGVLGFWGLALVITLVVGTSVPWPFYPAIAALTVAAALLEARDPDHLRADRGTPGPR